MISTFTFVRPYTVQSISLYKDNYDDTEKKLISHETAYLYYKFMSSIENTYNKKELQAAIWYLEGYNIGTLSTTAQGYVNDAILNAGNSYWGVQVMDFGEHTSGNYEGKGVQNLLIWDGTLYPNDNPTVPIPAAAWLLGSGLVGLLGIRKRFRKS